MDPIAPAAPAPPDPASPTDTLASLDAKEMQTWRETGEIPVREAPEPPDEGGDDEPEPEPAAAAPAQPVSKRQQRINDQIRQAVEAATKDDKAELARLRAAQPPVRQDPPKPAPAPALKADPNDPEPDPNDTTKFPGGEYDPKYLREAARWDMRQEQRKLEHQAQQRARHEQAETQFRGSAKAAADAFAARTKADPEFPARLDQTLLTQLIPISQLPPDLPGGPLNVIAEEMLAHPDTAPDVAEYFSTHRDDLARLTATDRQGVPLISARQLIREIGRIEGALKRGTDPLPLPNTITDAPAPPTTLGSRSTTAADPVASAVKSGDYEAYKRAADAADLAARGK